MFSYKNWNYFPVLIYWQVLSKKFLGRNLSVYNDRKRNISPATRPLRVMSRAKPSPPDNTFIDNVSRWIWRKIQPPCDGCIQNKHKAVDWLAWLPDSVHEKLHSSETVVRWIKYAVLTNLQWNIWVSSRPLGPSERCSSFWFCTQFWDTLNRFAVLWICTR